MCANVRKKSCEGERRTNWELDRFAIRQLMWTSINIYAVSVLNCFPRQPQYIVGIQEHNIFTLGAQKSSFLFLTQFPRSRTTITRNRLAYRKLVAKRRNCSCDQVWCGYILKLSVNIDRSRHTSDVTALFYVYKKRLLFVNRTTSIMMIFFLYTKEQHRFMNRLSFSISQRPYKEGWLLASTIGNLSIDL